MDSFLKIVNELSNEQKEIFYKYMGVLPACRNNINEKVEFLKFNNIKIVTAKALARVVSMDITDIKTRVKLYRENGLENIVLSNPEILRYNPAKIITRIKACEKIGKGYLIDGKPADFLFDDYQWNLIKGAIVDKEDTFSSLTKEIENKNELVDDYINNQSYDLDVLAFERYERLSRLLENVLEAIGSEAINMSKNVSSDEFLINKIGKNDNRTDKEIIKECLQQCFGLSEGVDEIIDGLLFADNNLGEKRGR